MRKPVLACLLLALTLSQSACDGFGGSRQAESRRIGIAWDRKAAEQLRLAVQGRAAHGLDRLPFAVTGRPGTADGDDALSESALRYARALATGALDPAKLYPVYTLPRPAPDLRAGLAQAVRDGRVRAWLEGLAPRDDAYRALSRTYLSYRGAGSAPAVPAGSTPPEVGPIEPGETDARVPLLAGHLVEEGYLAPSLAGGTAYGPAMVRAVRLLQADYGIEPDGVIGGETAKVLTLSDADRAGAIAVAMERMRWLARNPPPTRIEVNIATARLSYWREGALVDTRKVVVGDPQTPTPQLGSPLENLVANPTWTVPPSIQRKEMADKDQAYFSRNHMVWKNGRIVQESGPENSLGLVKFDLRNTHAIYLHDTPAKQLFDQVQRQRSHGCVRVYDALGFAQLLAQDEDVVAQWDKARATQKESHVRLPQAIPVLLFYQPVALDENGVAVIRADPYGWNDRVSAGLGFPATAVAQFRSTFSDVGP